MSQPNKQQLRVHSRERAVVEKFAAMPIVKRAKLVAGQRGMAVRVSVEHVKEQITLETKFGPEVDGVEVTYVIE